MASTPVARLLSRVGCIVMTAIALGTGSAAIAQAPCNDCGQVTSIRLVQEEGQGSGLGAVAGGVLGGVLGHQIGSGTGRTVATIAGAAGGAYVGNNVEKNKNAKSYWLVTLKMDGGNTRTFHYSNQPSVREGERVKLVDGGKRLALIAN
jgi:outer membrane lipoprotein SlyB